MAPLRWNVSAGAVLLFALLYFFDDAGWVAALVPAALAHELGHAAALRLCRARLRRISIGVFGIEREYAGVLSGMETLLALAAGPAAGFIYAVAACSTGTAYGSLSGALSFCLSVLNLLPALPLDGGRIVAELAGERFAAILARACALALTAGGTALLAARRAPALLIGGLWLLAYSYRDLPI